MLCYVMSFYVTSCHITSCYVMLCYVTSCHVISCHFILYYVMSSLACYVKLCPHNRTPRLHPFVSMTLHNTAFYFIQCTSALTGKVDKEKQKRDLEIINAARENNIFNLSPPSHTSPPPPATSLRCVVFLSCLRVWCFSLTSVCGVSL
jgi:hypothetical protein